MPTPSRKTPQRIERMVSLFKAGASTREIGEELGVSHAAIGSWLADVGLEPNGGNGARSRRRRHAVNGTAGAVAGAVQELAAVSNGTAPKDRGGAIEHLQARLSQITTLADQLARGVPGGATNPQALAAVVRLESDIASKIAELTPRAPTDPENDPANLEAAADVRREIETLVSAIERSAVCAHCGKNPNGGT